MNNFLNLVYFSPTETTKNILHIIKDEMGFSIEEEYNLTDYKYQYFKHAFEENDVILLGFPVYGGRVPKTAKNRFTGLKGNGAKAILILTYGNVHYDNSLIEIYEIMKNNGFTIIGMAAFVTRHPVVKSIGLDRPNSQDFNTIKDFSKIMVKKLSGKELSSININTVKSFGKYNTIPIKPKGNKNCVKCGLCVTLCPENAIENKNPRKTNKEKCICCMRCIKNCPQKARNYTKFEYFLAKILITSIRRIKYNKEIATEIIV